MKKIYLTLIAIFSICQFSYAQWTTSGTNIYNSNSGNVGVGTTSPAYTLQVVGTGAFSGSVGLSMPPTAAGASIGNNLFISTDATGYSGVYLFRDGVYSQAMGGFIRYRDPYRAPGGVQDLEMGMNGTNDLVINSSGNIGIGTSSPTNLLHIYGSTAYPLLNIQNAVAGYYSQMAYTGTGSTFYTGVGNASETTWGVSNSWYIFDATHSAMRFVINSSGNVLIGKTSQTNTAYLLDVAGSVRANAITVNTTGADFVFEPTYSLFPLSNLKKYIDQNHHLPEIPSAKEMQTNGLNVGENQTKLLQKVEELTLYLIEKDNEIKKEQLINQTQQEQINQLKEQLEALVKSLGKSK